MAETERIRLHICPFNAGLFDTIIPKALQPAATGVSYHSVQTFPERGFGYVELPKADADKLRKKFNGLILRGAKMNVQEAKPEKRRRDKEEPKDDQEEVPRKKSKKTKLNKKGGEYAGFELPEDRHVKRGWTEEAGKVKKSKDRKDKDDKSVKREKSKYISGKEVLFKQKLPQPALIAQKAESKEKKDKKSKKPKSHVVIHEFEKTKQHPSFLKSEVTAKTGIASEYIQGKGWVDADGNVVEAIEVKPKREDRIAQIPEVPMEVRISKPAPQDPVAQNIITAGAKALEKADKKYDSDDSDSEDASESDEKQSDDSESEPESEEESEQEAVEEEQDNKKEEAKPIEALHQTPSANEDSDSEESSPSENEDDQETENKEVMDIDPQTPPATPPREVHPLEALFKRPKPSISGNETPKPAPINTSFSFFGGDNNNNEENDNDDTADALPQTPFASQELRGRGIRSAAPTPDTAAIGRRFTFSFDDNGEIEEDADVDDAYPGVGDEDANFVPLGSRVDGDEKEETEFAKWFWENRGDTNRAWKKRRREVLKQKRQRENRRLSRRVV